MADPHRGKELFAQRVEYPLPKKAGTKDYVFYFVPQGDGYRDAGESSSPSSTRDHVARRPHPRGADRRPGGGSRRRRHAHPRDRDRSPTATPSGCSSRWSTASRRPTCGNTSTSPRSPSPVSRRTSRPASSRAEPSARRSSRACGDDSWVTIRACNFGRSEKGMYSVYAFFGGKANVYAPDPVPVLRHAADLRRHAPRYPAARARASGQAALPPQGRPHAGAQGRLIVTAMLDRASSPSRSRSPRCGWRIRPPTESPPTSRSSTN